MNTITNTVIICIDATTLSKLFQIGALLTIRNALGEFNSDANRGVLGQAVYSDTNLAKTLSKDVRTYSLMAGVPFGYALAKVPSVPRDITQAGTHIRASAALSTWHRLVH
jgi:hypothetical protein